jgi:hypothetical protein
MVVPSPCPILADLSLPSCYDSLVLYFLSWMYYHHCLLWLSCPSCPVPAPVLAIVDQLSCHSYLVHRSPDVPVLLLLSSPGLSSLFCPGWPVRLTCLEWPVPAALSYWSYPRWHMLTVLQWLSHPHCPVSSCPVLAVMFWPPCPLFPFLDVLSQLSSLAILSCPACPVLPVLSCLSYPSCPAPSLFSAAHLSSQSVPCCHVLASCPLYPIPADLSRLTFQADLSRLTWLTNNPNNNKGI